MTTRIVKSTAFKIIGYGLYRVYNINRPSQYLILKRRDAAMILKWIRLGFTDEMSSSFHGDNSNYELVNE